MNKEVLELVRERGVLLEKEIFDSLQDCSDVGFAKSLLENLEKASGQKMITRASLNKNFETVQKVVKDLPEGEKTYLEKIFVNLGLNIEIKRERVSSESVRELKDKDKGYRIFYAETKPDKKISVQDFVGHFRSRYRQLQKILMQRTNVEDLTAINKLSGNRQNFTLIGLVSEKRVTKNKHLIITIEDLTGKISALVKSDKECFQDAVELQYDEVVAMKCSGNNEIVFVQEIIHPDSVVPDKTKFEEDFCLAFISDIHVGSYNFMRKEFDNFISWLGSEDPLAKKVKYIFIVGDSVDGVGVFPGQEHLLEFKSLKSQYDHLAEFMKRVPSDKTVFMCPGQHDASRVLEPQPVLDKTYAGALYEIDNFIMVSNPCMVKLYEGSKEFKVLMYHGASIHPLINGIEELRIGKAQKTPAKAVRHMLKRRHLAPMHGVSHSIVYVPNADKDPMVIEETPDLFCTGEVHRLDIEKYNGTLILTGSCWQSQTDFEEKVGNIPDPCKVPVFNINSHELKILDFSLPEDLKEDKKDGD